MIERLGNQIELICNGCDTPFRKPTHADDRHILLLDARARGWRRYKSGNAWHDSCPSCVRDFAMKNRRLL